MNTRTLKNEVSKWRKMPLAELKVYESNLWFMISEFGQADFYAVKHRALRRVISDYPVVRRRINELSKEKEMVHGMVKKYFEAIKQGDTRTAKNYNTLLRLTTFFSQT